MKLMYLIIALSSLSHLQASQPNNFWDVADFFDRLSGKVTGFLFDEEIKPRMSDLDVNEAIDQIEENELSEQADIEKLKAQINKQLEQLVISDDSEKIEKIIEDINVLKNEFTYDSKMAIWLTEKLNHIHRFLKHFKLQETYNIQRSSSFDEDLAPVRFDTIDKSGIRKEIDDICKALPFDSKKASLFLEKLMKMKTGTITQEDRLWLDKKIDIMKTVIQQ